MKPRNAFLALVLTLVTAVTAAAQPELAGIGVAIMAGEPAKGPQIREVVPASPAAKAKLTEGLIIMKVDNKLTAGKRLEDCVSMIRGPAGTTVELELTDPSDAKTMKVTLTREKLDVSR
ncbi:MAG: S41 family peptidase [Verrucomicrobiales bacterium]